MNRGKSYTLIDAIDNSAGLRHYYLFKGSNRTKILTEFSKGLISKLPKRPSVIIMDNLPIHYAHAVKDLFKSSNT